MNEKHQDLTLVRSALDGDTQDWERLVERLGCVRPFLVSLANKQRVRLPEQELEDVAADILMQIVRQLETFRGDAAIETWAYRFCELQLMNHRRKTQREPKQALEDLADELEAPATTPAFEDDLAGFLRHLAPREAEIVELRFEAGLNLEEIAAALEISPSSVKTSYYRALTKLRKVLGSQETGDPS